MISQRLVVMHSHLYTFSMTFIEMRAILKDYMWRWKRQHCCVWGKTALLERGKTVPRAILARHAVWIWYVNAIKLWCIYSIHNILNKKWKKVDESSDEEECFGVRRTIQLQSATTCLGSIPRMQELCNSECTPRLPGRLRLSYASYSRNPTWYPVYDHLHCARSTTRVIQLNTDDRDHAHKPLM